MFVCERLGCLSTVIVVSARFLTVALIKLDLPSLSVGSLSRSVVDAVTLTVLFENLIKAIRRRSAQSCSCEEE